jgi:aerobic-type carbon monoxide dehydrogenase small subunit (CoxS/CutS family)
MTIVSDPVGLENFKFSVNGQPRDVRVEPTTPLLYILRNELGLFSARYGCGEEQCGACKVIVDGKMGFACSLTAAEINGSDIRTLEGLAEQGTLHAIQQAFLDENAAQCGYCSSGIILAAVLLLEENQAPSRSNIQRALAGHLCRCGAHNRIIRAIQQAAGALS